VQPNPVPAFKLTPEHRDPRARDVHFVALRIERGDDVDDVPGNASSDRLSRDKQASTPRH
jgi:hypothetical protein